METTKMDAEKAEESFSARRTESVDAEGISQLITRHTDILFGRVNVERLIEHANLAISLISADSVDTVLGHISLLDYPNVSAVDQAKWEQWIHSHYQPSSKISPVNTLFMHLFTAKESFHQGASTELLRTAFMAVPLLQFIFLVVPSGTNIGSALATHFTAVPIVSDSSGGGGSGEVSHEMYVTHRYQHYPMLHVRAAVVEDTDDLTPIFKQCSTNIQEQYGEFFLAELIACQDDAHQTLVADVDGRAVGFLSVSSEVDVDLLNSLYQLEPFHCLKKPEQSDEVQSVSTYGTHTSSTVTLLSSSQKSVATHSVKSSKGEPTTTASSSSVAAMSDKPTPTATSQTSKSEIGSTVTSGESEPEKQPPPELETESVEPATQSAVMGAEVVEPSPGTPQPQETQQPQVVAVAVETRPKARKKQYVLKGGPSAVAVQLFAIDDKYEMRSVDLLPAVFKLFPDHDYLVLTLPPSMPEFPLLSQFTRITPRVGVDITQELYVLHKCSLLHSFTVSPVQSDDIAAIEHLILKLHESSCMLEDIKRYVEARRDPIEHGGTTISAMVAKCAEQVVGVAILRNEEDIGYIRSHYNIEDFVYFNYHLPTEHAHLNHFVLNPVFQPYSKHFIKELLRLSHKTCLYYPLYSSLNTDLHTSTRHSIITALQHMIPLSARRQIVYPKDLSINAPLPELTREVTPYSLYHTNRKLTLEPKITVNSRIVVVGSSEVAISFLEQLVYSPHLLFTNLVLVSPHGLSISPPSITTHNPWVTSNTTALLGLNTWVNVIKGKLTFIDRPQQYVKVESYHGEEISVLHYDYLVLTTGTQYQVPTMSGQPPPKHVFTVCDAHSEEQLLQWVKTKAIPNECTVVVYGSGLDAYCMVHSLLSAGQPPERLILVQPQQPTCFANKTVSGRVSEALKSLGVTVVEGDDDGVDGGVRQWMVEGESLQGVVLANDTQIECHAFVYMEEKHVDTQAFKAMNDACLVFDNRLVISADHSTNDPLILAAGPLTKFSRRYRADEWSHANFNSTEVGEKLATEMLFKLDPTSFGTPTADKEDLLIPVYTKPKALTATLPGGLHYLHVYKPRLSYKRGKDESIRELVTDTTRGYFSVIVNQYAHVDELVVLSSEPLEQISNYLCLYNIHEKYLNNMVSRYDEELITDFFSYFEEPWACALFHDRFTDFMDEVQEHLAQLPLKTEGEDADKTLEDHVRALVEDDPHGTLTQHRSNLMNMYENSSVKEVVHKRLFRFLHYNSQLLPMYTKPDTIIA